MKEFKIISCASFGSSGSGIVTDYLLEFDNIYNPGDYEFRFLQDFGGLTTLEDSLLHSHHRLNSDIAIRLFKKIIDYHSGDWTNKRYEKFFHGQFKEISYKFLNELIEVKWDGYWEEYQVLSPRFITLFKYKIYPRILRLLHGNIGYIAKYVPRSTMYFSNPTPEYFLDCVRRYLNNLFRVIDRDHNYEYLFFDQLLPSDDINRYFKYFDNLNVVVVDRDPRDYYIENVLKWGEGWVPIDIEKFVCLYKGIRKKIDISKDNPNILRLSFEDAIYKYDDFSDKINRFLGLSSRNHVRLKQNFDPNKSIRNTQLWKTTKVDLSMIEYIEKELGEYYYSF